MGCTGSKMGCKTPEPTMTEDGQPRQEVAAPPNSLQGNLARTRQVQSVSECYELVEVLGKGNYGEVQRAVQRETGRTCALKCIKKESIKELDGMRNEIALLRRIEHPNVVRLLEVLETDSAMYFSMQLCEGGTVLDLLNSRQEGLPESDVKHILARLLSALSFLHHSGICHRDVKLENLCFDHQGVGREVMLVDLGTGKRFTSGEHMHRAFGSIFYLAPEMIELDYTEKCDVWSAGVCAYMLCCKSPPFVAEGDNPADVQGCMSAIQWNEPAFDGNAAFKSFSKPAVDTIRRLLCKTPGERPSAEEALQLPWLRDVLSRNTIARASSIKSKKAAMLDGEGDGSVSPGEHGAACHQAGADTESGDDAGVRANDDDDGRASRGSLRTRAKSRSIWGGILSWERLTPLRKTAQLVLAFMLEPELVRERRDMFESIDTAQNGVITLDELRCAISALPSSREGSPTPEVMTGTSNADDVQLGGRQRSHTAVAAMSESQQEDLFRSLDMDGTGRVNYLEFLAATVPSNVLKDETKLRYAFNRIDCDNSGYISNDNLRELMGADYCSADVDAMIASADIKRNGHIDFEEFLALMNPGADGNSMATAVQPSQVAVEMDSEQQA